MDFTKVMTITALVFALLTLIFNFIRSPFHIFGDIYIDRVGIKFYIPVVSTIVVSILVTILLASVSK